MFDKINVNLIVRDHLSTLRNDATKKIGLGDYSLFLLIPILVFISSTWYGVELKENMVTLLISAFAIFAGLLINVLVLIYTVALRIEDKPHAIYDRTLEIEFLKEIFSNVSFGILLSIVIVFILALCATLPSAANVYATGFALLLITEFTFTFIMSLKRLHILLSNRLRSE